MEVGIIGLGAMGLGMAKNLANAGLLTAVYNRTESKAEQFAEQFNLTHCVSVQQLVKQVGVIVICVSTDDVMLHMVSQISECIVEGSVVIDMSTTSSETALQASSVLSNKKAYFLDAPVSGGVEGAKNGTLAVMVGGETLALQKVIIVLEAMSQQIQHMGPVGSGQSTKAVNQIMAAGINQAVTDALAFGQHQNLDMGKVINIISQGAAGNWFLQHRGNSMIDGAFEPGFKLALHYKDLKICQEMAKKSSCPSNIIDKTLKDYKKLMDLGFCDEDISALYRLKRE